MTLKESASTPISRDNVTWVVGLGWESWGQADGDSKDVWLKLASQ